MLIELIRFVRIFLAAFGIFAIFVAIGIILEWLGAPPQIVFFFGSISAIAALAFLYFGVDD